MTHEELTDKLAKFAEWLETRAKRQEAEFRAKGWGDTKTEVRRIKEEFDSIFNQQRISVNEGKVE